MARFLSITLGGVFFVAGLSKLFVLDAFAATIAGIAFIPIQAGLVLAAMLVCIETAGAIALLVNFKVRLVSLLFCLLVAVFLWVLASAIIQGREITCNCFGVLGIRLDNRQEFLLDLGLFNAFGILAFLESGAKSQEPVGPKLKGMTVVLVLVLMALEAALAQFVLDRGRHVSGADAAVALRFAASVDPAFVTQSDDPRTLLLVRLEDLNCPPCADDFFRLADSLDSCVGVTAHRVVALVDVEPLPTAESNTVLQQWVKKTGFQFPAVAMPEAVSDSISLRRSTAVVINDGDSIVFSHRFPMGLAKRLLAQQLMRR